MRSLTVKLTLAFLLVGLTGSMVISAMTWWQTRSEFNRFIVTREQQGLVDNLVDYFQINGSWQGVDAVLVPGPERLPLVIGDPHDNRRAWIGPSLIGADQTIIYSPLQEQLGRKVSNRELELAIPLTINGETTGWLLLAPAPRDWIPNSPEALFFRNINRAALVSALAAATLALILGGALAYTMTRSLRELTEATLEIAKGKLGKQVAVRSKDEIGELAASFNKMSRDLAQATEARRRMTADVAHDLRSPLSVISGYAEALSDGKLPGTPEIYGILHQETRHLSRLIEDLRTLSLADAGELQLYRQSAAPQAILDWVLARQTLIAKQKGISLVSTVDPGLPTISVDMERMVQVFDNLIANALRYTPIGGEILLSARQAEGVVLLKVQDNGSGISPEDLPHVFDRFYRADKSRQQNGETGLGLAIARSIIEAHGGTITVESSPGKETTFTIRLLPEVDHS
jgi:signal transduction histidine kinase